MIKFYLINFLITFISEAIKDFDMKQVIWLLLKMEEGLPTVTDHKQMAGTGGEKEIKVNGQIKIISPTVGLLLIQAKMFTVISALLTPLLIDPTTKD